MGIRGALMFAGFGEGRENKRSWFRVGMADGDLASALRMRPIERARFAPRSDDRSAASQRCREAVTLRASSVSTSSTTRTTALLQPSTGIRGLPAYTLAALYRSRVLERITVDWWQGQEAVRAPENLYWTFSMQREVDANTVSGCRYNANIGTHLQTGLLNYNQVPTKYLDQFVQQYGPTQALSLLSSNINSAQARAANIPIPYPSFPSQRLQHVAQALRPYPQYQNITTGVQNGDKSGHSSYHAMVLTSIAVTRRV